MATAGHVGQTRLRPRLRRASRLDPPSLQVTATGGNGRTLDNVFVERLWRSVKYEEVFLNDCDSVWVTRDRLGQYFEFYNR